MKYNCYPTIEQEKELGNHKIECLARYIANNPKFGREYIKKHASIHGDGFVNRLRELANIEREKIKIHHKS